MTNTKLQKSIDRCRNIINDLEDLSHALAEDDRFSQIPPEALDHILNILSGMIGLYSVRFSALDRAEKAIPSEDHDYPEIK